MTDKVRILPASEAISGSICELCMYDLSNKCARVACTTWGLEQPLPFTPSEFAIADEEEI